MKTYNILLSFFLILISGFGFSQSVPSYVPTNGLVGWWGFNGNAQDGSGNGNHGTVIGATLTSDRFGNQNGAYDFDGSSMINLGRLAIIDTLNETKDISYSVWFKAHQNQSQFDKMPLLSKRQQPWQTAGNTQSYFTIHAGGQAFYTRNNKYICYAFVDAHMYAYGINNGLDGGQTDDNNWHQLIATKNNNHYSMYFDGLLVDTITDYTILYSLDSMIIGYQGMWGFNSERWYTGIVDDIGIWNRALTQQEITNLYNSQLPNQTPLCLPTITTSSPTSVGVDTVVIGGDISNDGGSSIVLRGVCYSTSTNPNMGVQRTEEGSGTGSFSAVLRGLNPSTTYYARSYAKNSNGVVVYGNEVSFGTSSITIGSNYAGGIVFYVDSTGQHGLVCAPSNQGYFPWGCVGTDIPNTSTAVGTGAINTAYIMGGCSQRPIAASVCSDLVLNGYSDWYLPSLGELQAMYSSLHLQGLGGFGGDYYWSSSQVSPNDAWDTHFRNGFVDAGKVSNNQVRAVRAF
jgi:hypothetical protein